MILKMTTMNLDGLGYFSFNSSGAEVVAMGLSGCPGTIILCVCYSVGEALVVSWMS